MGDKKTVLIIEDEFQAQDKLIRYLSTREEFHEPEIAEDGEQGLSMLQLKHFDLLLLDINLPALSGIDILESLNKPVYVIFVTTYDKYAIKAFEFGAIDYLLKPFSLQRFNQAIDRFLEKKNMQKEKNPSFKEHSLCFKHKRIQHVLLFEDIIYVASTGRNCMIFTEQKEFEASSLLKEIEQKLPQNAFIRVHKQYIVNIDYIQTLRYDKGGQYELRLKDEEDTVLPVGKSYAQKIKQRLGT